MDSGVIGERRLSQWGRSKEEVREIFSSRPFLPPPWLRSGHLQTLAASRWVRQFPWGWTQSTRLLLDLRDGSRVSAVTVVRNPGAPTVVAFHGMGGSSQSSYMLAFSHKAYSLGWNAVLVDLYNVNFQLDRPKIFHAGCSADCKEILERLNDRPEFGPLLVVGVSMGGNILLKTLGEWGSGVPEYVLGAAALSPLMDLEKGCLKLDQPANSLYRWYFLRRLKDLTCRKASLLAQLVDLDKLLKVRSIREFDELVTAPLSGFQGASDYYCQSSSARWIGKIRIPTLIIHSGDDPLLPSEPLLAADVTTNPFLFTQLTDHGGHVGFIEGGEPNGWDRAWAENRILDFFHILVSEEKQHPLIAPGQLPEAERNDSRF